MNPTPPSAPPPTGSWGAAPTPPPRPRLTRRRDNKMLGGVCGGIADHLGIDPAIVRIVAVVLAFTGWGILLYLIAWAALPEADPGTPQTVRSPGAGRHRFPWLAAVIAVNLLWIIPSFGWFFWDGDFGPPMVPLLLLGGVAYLLWRATRGDLHRRPGGHWRPGHSGHRRNAQWNAPPPPVPSTGPVTETSMATSTAPAERPEWARDDRETGDENSVSPAEPDTPAGDAGPTEDPLLAEARRLSDPFLAEPLLFETAPPPAPAPPPSPRRRGGGRAFLAALLIGAGAVGLTLAFGVSLSPFTVLAGALIAIGVWLIFGGLSGRRIRGLIIPGLLVLGLISLVSAFDLPPAEAGERLYEPMGLNQVRESYELGLGELTVDLSAVEFPAEGRSVEASLGAGELVVIVPENVTVAVDASAGMGEVSVFGEQEGGIHADLDKNDPGTETGGSLDLDLHVGLGEVRVERAA